MGGVEVFRDWRGKALRIAARWSRYRPSDARAFAARADRDEDGAYQQVEAVRAIAGRGIEGKIDGRHWRLGQAGFAAAVADDGRIWLGDGERPVACFTLRESERQDARAAIDALRALGLTIHLSSGDGEAAVTRFAGQVGIGHAHARQSPEAKLELVHDLQGQGRRVAMVGDGLNDAPVLAGADVSLAMGEGAALAQRAADLVLTGASLMRIPQAVLVARRTRQVIRQNLAWALGYNLWRAAAAEIDTGWRAGRPVLPHGTLNACASRRLAAPGGSAMNICCSCTLACISTRRYGLHVAVRRGQFDDMDTPAIDILRDDPHERSRQPTPIPVVDQPATATAVEASTQQRPGTHAD